VYAPLAATRWDMTPARVLTSPRVHSDGTLAFRIGPCTYHRRANRTQESQGRSPDRKVLIFHSCIHDVRLSPCPSRAYVHFQECSDLQVVPGKLNSRAGIVRPRDRCSSALAGNPKRGVGLRRFEDSSQEVGVWRRDAQLDWMKRKIMKIARLVPQMRLRHFQLSLCGGVRDRGDSGLCRQSG
jgi:hypothetical protein